jgi:putative endonuclease
MERMQQSWVYIMASPSRTLYIGVTSNLDQRVAQHKTKTADGFTRKYNIAILVYAEEFAHIGDAIAREKQLQGWSRAKKIALIERENPHWLDLTRAGEEFVGLFLTRSFDKFRITVVGDESSVTWQPHAPYRSVGRRPCRLRRV